MDHAEIEQRGLIELYHRGALPPDEEIRFEEHFAGCAQCQEQLVYARGLQRSLKTMAAEDAVRAAAEVGVLAWLARRGRLAALGLLVVALAALPAWWMWDRGRQSAAVAEGWRQRWEGERRGAEELRRRLEESERRRAAEGRERVAAVPPAAAPDPVFNVPVFLLSTVRDGGAAVEIDLRRQRGPVALAVDAAEDFESYRVTVVEDGGRQRFRQGGLRPNALEAVLITFPEGFFEAGVYRLELEGMGPEGTPSRLGSYEFRVTGR